MSDAAELAALAERRLLAGVMWAGHRPDGVHADMFARPAHRAVWDACLTAEPLDPPTVVEQLARDGTLEVVGGAAAFWEAFAGQQVLPFEVDRLATEVAGWAWRRTVHRKAVELLSAAADLSQDPRSILADLDGLEAPSQAGLAVFSGDAIRDVPPPVWLVDGHLQDGFAMIFGPWSSGKSFVAADLAVAVASGQRWWGHPVTRGPVLYLALEGASGLAQRLQAAATSRQVGLDGVHLSGDPVNLGSRADVADVDQAVRRTGARLLVVDTWRRATAGADENDNGAAGRAVEALDRIRARRGCGVVVLHHSTKAEASNASGAGALSAAADSIWNVTKTGAGKIHVASAKQKDGEDFQPLTFALRPQPVSATLEMVSAGRPAAQRDVDRSAALDECRRGLVLKAQIRASYGDDTLASLCRHPDVREVLDDQDRPCVTAMIDRRQTA